MMTNMFNKKITEQEKFWKGEFGKKYTSRNKSINKFQLIGKNLINNNIKIKSAIELGSNVGLNLDALKIIYPKIYTLGIEINKSAFNILKKKHIASNCSILEYNTEKKFDLVISSLVLIHQNPKTLNEIYAKIYELTKKYIHCRIF